MTGAPLYVPRDPGIRACGLAGSALQSFGDAVGRAGSPTDDDARTDAAEPADRYWATSVIVSCGLGARKTPAAWACCPGFRRLPP